jgi:transcriptional regulator with XRE-family HTH domain
MRNVTTAILNALKAEKALRSDYKVAKLLRVRQQTISNYRSGRTQMSDEIAYRAARILRRVPGVLLLKLAAERATNRVIARVWRQCARTVAMYQPDRPSRKVSATYL